MILRLICPSGHVLDVDSRLAGRKVRCGACGRIMLVPAPPAAKRAAAAKPPRRPPPTPPIPPRSEKDHVSMAPGSAPAPGAPPVPEKPSIERPAAESPLVTSLLPQPPAVEMPLDAAAPAFVPPPIELPPALPIASPPPPVVDDTKLQAVGPAAEPPPTAPFVEELPAMACEPSLVGLSSPASIAPEPSEAEVQQPGLAALSNAELAQQSVPIADIESFEVPLATALQAVFPPSTPKTPDVAKLLAAEPAAAPPTITFQRKPFAAELPVAPSHLPLSGREAAGSSFELPAAEFASLMSGPPSAPLSPGVSEAYQPHPEWPAAEEDRLQPKLSPPDEPINDEAAALSQSRGARFLPWLRGQLPHHPAYLPEDAIEPTWSERRTARGLAAALAGVALLNLLPAVLSGHILSPFSAPPWATLAAVLAVVQLVYAGWLANAPDWSTVQVQMVVSAASTTIYAMVMTLAILTPLNRSLLFGLDEVRWPASAWCGLMTLVMGSVTWYCGQASARWRQELAENRL